MRTPKRVYLRHLPMSDYYGRPIVDRKDYLTVCRQIRFGRNCTWDPEFLNCPTCVKYLRKNPQWFNRLRNDSKEIFREKQLKFGGM